MLSLRIVNVDYYLTPPLRGLDVTYSHFRGAPVKQVPVIRVFGITDSGFKGCIHVHGVLPYIYIPFDWKENPDSVMYEIAYGLDKAINENAGNYDKQHVFKIVLVTGVPFYGYHSKERQFLKIYFYNPATIKKSIQLLQNAKICNKKIQPYEAHIPFILQFFIDYNLYGMNFIHLTEWVPRSLNYEDEHETSSETNCKITYCELEGDAQAENIKNRTNISGKMNPGLANIWAEELERRTFDGKSPDCSLSESQERLSVGLNELEHKFKEQLIQSLKSRHIPGSESLPEASHISEPLKYSEIPAASLHVPLNGSNHEYNDVENINEPPDNSIFLNSMDMSLINAINELMEEGVDDTNTIENDSILGTQKSSEESDEEGENVDLSQPLCLSQSDSDGELEISEQPKASNNKNNSFKYIDKDNIFLCDFKKTSMKSSSDDFINSEIKTPEKKTKGHICDASKRRYQPLQILIQKSPNKSSEEERKEFNSRNPQQVPDVELLKQLECSAALISEKIRSPNASPLIKQNSTQAKINREGTVERVKKKIKIEFKSGKKEEARTKLYNSLRVNVFKNSKNGEEAENCTPEIGTSEIKKLHEVAFYSSSTNEHLSDENDIVHIQNHVRKCLLPNLSLQKSSTTFNNEIESQNVYVEPQNDDGSSDKTLQNNSRTSDFTDTLNYTEVGSFYNTIHYDYIAQNKYQGYILNKNCFEPLCLPPSYDEVLKTLGKYGLAKCLKKNPFYGKPDDALTKKEVGCELVKISSNSFSSLENFEGTFSSPLNKSLSDLREMLFLFGCKKDDHRGVSKYCLLTPVENPPKFNDAVSWINNNKFSLFSALKTQKKKKVFVQHALNSSEAQSLDLSFCSPFEISQSSVQSLSHTEIFDSLAIKSNTKDEMAANVSSIQNKDKVNVHNSDINLSKVSNSSGSMCLQPELDVKSDSNALEYATPENSGLFKTAFQNLQDVRTGSECKYLTLFELEIHVPTRGELRPDPECDPIGAVFYSILNDVPANNRLPRQITGVIICAESKDSFKYGLDCSIIQVTTELDLINELIILVRKTDPDILTGYEIEMSSWGYIVERGYKLGINLTEELNRLRRTVSTNSGNSSQFPGSELKLVGRIVLNVWRLMRHEAALMSYSFENVIYHILHTRVPTFSLKKLTLWWSSCSNFYRELTIKHYIVRVLGVIQLLEQLDLIGRTCELASLFGIQFYEVFSRGSQFRVESMMLRMAKPLNYIAISPSIEQRAAMKAPECLPLIMEPKSRFYSDPVIVLDFQSLYPSMIIAYNYCFSTCLGRIQLLIKKENIEFGCSELEVSTKELLALKDNIHISPTGIGFVKPNVRTGVLPQMLEEILNTRLMVKQSLKANKNNKLLKKVLDARQLGLKLIANVTYGYTSANFSGRMACVEVADSVVSKGRETLENAIKLVRSSEKWGAEVVYGDTDSLFVLCPGKSRQEAFQIGQEIADAVTKVNPKPVKLKLEKVYQPCILQTKKRYVGYMYESVDQQLPVYDAKGIETVRRDGCPAVSKVLEKSLKILFETYDVSKVKDYVSRQMIKLVSGKLSIQELTFAREYRGLSSYKPGACVPALKLAKELLSKDRRAEPRTGERVGYIVACGPPGLPLISSVYSPIEFLANPSLRINSDYYISKVILPPLDRCFALLSVDVHSWYNVLPRRQYKYLHDNSRGLKKGTISQYFSAVDCLGCSNICNSGVCESCQLSPQMLAVKLTSKINKWERKHFSLTKLCFSCCGGHNGNDCSSMDCPILYSKMLAEKELGQVKIVKQLLDQNLPEIF